MLKSGVEAISQGTYDGPLDIKTGDEFEELAVAVHRMADRLQSSRAELESLNAELVHRVEEKTAEITCQMRKLELSERLATLGKVASGIAHEINNPLGIILNRIECMEADAAQAGVPEQVGRDLVTIRTQAERISRVTRSILTFSRGTVSMLKPLDLNCVARTCVAMAGERVAALAVRIDAQLAPEVSPVMGDRDRLETVLLNLINNAIDAVTGSDTQGMITVSTARMPIDGDEWVRISVSDNGPGVPTEILDRIFDPFFTTKPAGQGTGLGLFLSYGIVSDHRGRIEVRNHAVGAVFDVYLPAVAFGNRVHEGTSWGLQEKS